MMRQNILILGLIIITGAFLSSCLFFGKEGTSSGTPPLGAEFYRGNFSVSEEPVLNRVVELTFTLEAAHDAPNTSIEIFLPEGIELVEGSLVWRGDLRKNEKVEHRISVKVVREGEWRIRAWVSNEKFRGFDRAFFACVVSTRDSGKILKSCPTPPSINQPAKRE